MRKIVTIIVAIYLLALPAISFALELNYPKFGPGDNKITIDLNMNLNDLIVWFYYFMIGISGLAAFVTLVRGGVIWLTSAGNPTKAAEAKDLISSAFFGLVVVLGSWLILRTINPDLTVLTLPALPQ